MKTRIAAIVSAFGGLCALEAFFCDSPWAIGMGAGLMTIGVAYLAYKYWKGFCARTEVAPSCSLECGCK